MDHDRLYKELLGTFFPEFVELLLPELASYLKPGSLVFLDKELYTDVTAGERHEADMVAKASFQGEEHCFLVHVEHQARPEGDFGRRMLRYFARLHERHGLPVYPVVLYSHERPATPQPEAYQVDFPGRRVLDFRFHVLQLNRMRWQDYLQHPNPVASALMTRMGVAREERPRVKWECLRMLAKLGLDPARTQLVSGFVDSYLKLEAHEQSVFAAAMAAADPKEQEGVMEIVTSWMEEGLQKGRQEGIGEGLQKGEALIVLRLLARKVGLMDGALREQVAALAPERLESLAEALLDFNALADLEAWLARP